MTAVWRYGKVAVEDGKLARIYMPGEAIFVEAEFPAADYDSVEVPTGVADGSLIWDRLTRSFVSPPPLPPAVPRRVTPLQIRKAIRAAGLHAAVEGFKTSCSEEILEAWEFASAVDRDDPLIMTAAAGLELTTEQVDDLFILAATF